MKKKRLLLLLLLTFSLIFQVVFFPSCGLKENKYHSLNIIRQDHVAIIHEYMQKEGYKKEDYTIVERFSTRDWLPYCYSALYGAEFIPFPYVLHASHNEAKTLDYSVCICENGKTVDVLSFRITDGVLYEEKTSETQKQAVSYTLNPPGFAFFVPFYSHDDCEVSSVYYIENIVDDAKFVYYKTTAGGYIYFHPGEEYGGKGYLLPLYALAKIAEANRNNHLDFNEGTVAYMMENSEAALAPYDITPYEITQ